MEEQTIQFIVAGIAPRMSDGCPPSGSGQSVEKSVWPGLARSRYIMRAKIAD